MKLFLYLTGFLIFFSAFSILPTTVNGRFTIISTSNSEVTVLVQINTNTGTDDLGGATIVVSFDTNAVKFHQYSD